MARRIAPSRDAIDVIEAAIAGMQTGKACRFRSLARARAESGRNTRNGFAVTLPSATRPITAPMAPVGLASIREHMLADAAWITR